MSAPRHSLLLEVVWHAFVIGAILVAPAAVTFAGPFWVLPGEHLRLVVGLAAMYFVASLVLIGLTHFRGYAHLAPGNKG